MSYILEALKKSDRERRQGEIPGLQSDHGKRLDFTDERKKGAIWRWIAAAALFLFLPALFYYQGMRKNDAALREKLNALEQTIGQLQDQPASSDSAQGPSTGGRLEPQPPATTGEETTSSGHPQGMERMPTIDTMREIPDILPPVATTSAAAQTVDQRNATRPTEDLPLLHDLPAAIRKRLPPLTFAGHVYAEDAAKRMIIINNRICREGDMVEDQLYLDRIVWEGVILRYQDLRFRMDLL